jgi:hypothetical protein
MQYMNYGWWFCYVLYKQSCQPSKRAIRINWGKIIFTIFDQNISTFQYFCKRPSLLHFQNFSVTGSGWNSVFNLLTAPRMHTEPRLNIYRTAKENFDGFQDYFQNFLERTEYMYWIEWKHWWVGSPVEEKNAQHLCLRQEATQPFPAAPGRNCIIYS